ncbi:ABC transporter, partial [Georgenia sp. 10Sc9-8]|nr:ABC transporter [Georgenia halotolerans]
MTTTWLEEGQADGARAVLAALTDLRDVLASVRLPLDLPGAAAAREARAGVVDQLEDYLIPRYQQLEAPLLAVVGGSTGAGKSTLVNSLVGERVST